ncbi:MAG: hypothetical protein UU15_C0045G0006 [Candidatus Levybacteria bacterium GW2011_GWC2_40_7]|nr:MAG: hypothetical protein UU15_C0045G0006 [Candidatus Levybacteria bacterium GW2011_GWC2_40_7]
MKKTVLPKASTQKFTEVKEIQDNLVLFLDNSAVSVVEVNATNFTLQSQAEQDSKIASYASFLNSLSFSIEIIIRSQKLDIASYLATLDIEAQRSKNQNLSSFIKSYKTFVEELLKTKVVLDKRFYIVIPYSPLERGVSGAKKKSSQTAAMEANSVLRSKTESVLMQIKRVGLSAKLLSKEELITLFHDFYNISGGASASDAKSPMVLSQKPFDVAQGK